MDHHKTRWVVLVSGLLLVPTPGELRSQDYGHRGFPAMVRESHTRPPAFDQQGPSASRLVVLPIFGEPIGNGGIFSATNGISMYPDLNSAVGLLDYSCGVVTYDGHTGTDILVRTFLDMDTGVPVLAATSGTVTGTHDGEFDRHSEHVDTAISNWVSMDHGNGIQSYYYHFRKSSIRVGVGETVQAGDTLGFVGSSGRSNWPHLHFEVWDGPTWVDPFTGSCQPDSSRWLAQRPYALALPFLLMDHGATTVDISTRKGFLERPPTKRHIVAGDTARFWIQVRNGLQGDSLRWELYANGGFYSSYGFSIPESYPISWWYVWYVLPVGQAYHGQWEVRAFRNGAQIAAETFQYDDTPNAAPVVSDSVYYYVPTNTYSGALPSVADEGEPFMYEIVQQPANGMLELFGPRRSRFTYSPNPVFSGIDTALVRVMDDEGLFGPPAMMILYNQLINSAEGAGHPVSWVLDQNFPNPFNPSTRIDFSIGSEADVRLTVTDVLGRTVATLANGTLDAGTYSRTWETDRSPSGVYFYVLNAIPREERRITLVRKMLLVR